MEYSDNDGHYRFSLISPRSGYELIGAQPSCIAGKGSVHYTANTRKYTEARRMIQLTNFLATHNRYYSYRFRDISCVRDGSCVFPEPGAPFRLGVV